MTNAWSIFIIVLVIGNIIGLVWLLFATNRPNGIQNDKTMGHEWDGIAELNKPLPRWWLWLFILSVVFALAYLYLYPGLGNYSGHLGWTQMREYEQAKAANIEKQKVHFSAFAELDIEQLANNSSAMQTAGRLFANNCATCHGSDAGGARGFPDLTDNDWLFGNSAEQIQQSIAEGRNGNMPNLGLNDLKVGLLANYVANLSGRKVTAHSKIEGKKHFAICTGCHGHNGEGNQLLGAPNLTDNIWLHGDSIADIKHTLRNGRQSRMPAFKTLLSDDEIRLLSAYVLSFSVVRQAQ